MESCFPPLASLSLRGSSNSTSSSSASSTTSAKGTQKNRHSLGVSGIAASNGSGGGDSEARNNNNYSSEYLPKLDVIQDLDLYYIRQIACSLKVSPGGRSIARQGGDRRGKTMIMMGEEKGADVARRIFIAFFVPFIRWHCAIYRCLGGILLNMRGNHWLMNSSW